jgi:hypothetical protein
VRDFLLTHRRRIWWCGVGAAAAFVTVYIVASLHTGTLVHGQVWQKVMLAFYFLWKQDEDPIEETKHSYELSKNFWIAVGLLLTAICFGDEILKHF